MAFVYTLCSSSKGNCTYIGDTKRGILIDAGIGIRNFNGLLKLRGIEPQAVKAVFVTHEHTDHISGLKKITSLIDIPVFGTRETLEEIIEKDAVDARTKLYEINKKKKIVAGFEVSAFDTPHDSRHSTGYCVHTSDLKKITVCTDLGRVTESIQENLTGSDLVLIESNYDEDMLANGIYPPYLKRRIAGDFGHLSNVNASQEIKRLIICGTKKFILGHLSEENNTPETAFAHCIKYLSEFGMKINSDFALAVAPKKSIGKIIEV